MSVILNIQIKSVCNNVESNLKKIEYFLSKNADKKPDLVLMPEFFSTSTAYINNAENEDGGETIKFISELAKKYKTNIVAGSIVRKADKKLYNTSFAINRDGVVIEKYDKIHLFDYLGGTEGNEITAGKEIKIAEFDFAKVGLAICFDVRYPLLFKELAKSGVDIIVLPTAWLVPGEIYNDRNQLQTAKEMWISMLRTRAYDNMCYFVVSNQTKDIMKGFFGIGNSMIISPTAEILAKIDENEGAISAEVEFETLKYLRNLFPIAKID